MNTNKDPVQKGGLLLAVLLCSMYSMIAQQRPNIILIMADDMGYSDLSCYGSEIPTPNLDKLASKGIRLRQFYNTARCCPTRASLLTGLFPHQTGIGHMTEEPANQHSENWGTPGYQGFLNRNCVTIAEALAPAGFHTYMSGKWHLGFHGEEKWPVQRGFEKYYGVLAGATSYFKPQGGRGLYYNNEKLPAPRGDYYTTDAFTDSAIAFIDEQKDNAPFFLYLAYNAPHFPLQAKPEDIKKFEGKYTVGWDTVRQERYLRQCRLGIVNSSTLLSPRDTAVRAWNALSKAEQQEAAYRMTVYAAQVSCMDQNIGKLLLALDLKGITQNTLIIFLSDNGACAEPYKELGGGAMAEINDPEKSSIISYGMGWANVSNTPYRKWKTELEEGGIAAPFIIYWPKGISAKQQNKILDIPSYQIDVMPTLLEIAGAKYPVAAGGDKIFPLEGRSITPLFTGMPLSKHNYMYWEHQGNEAIRHNDWKAVKDTTSAKWELYDLSKDKTEQHDLSARYPAIARALAIKWEKWALIHDVFPKHSSN